MRPLLACSLLLASLAVGLGIAARLGDAPSGDRNPARAGVDASGPAPAALPAPVPAWETALEGVSLVESSDDGEAVSFSARSVAIGKRIGAGGLFVYQDVRDVVASHVEISIQVPAGGEGELLRVVEGIVRLFPARIRGSTERRELRGRNRSERRETRVTRVLFTDLSISLARDGRETVSIAADGGRLNLASKTLALDGGMAMVTPGGERVQAPIAVLSSDFDGMYAPMGYTLDGVRRSRKASLVMGEDGRLDASHQGRPIEYTDDIEHLERIVLAHYLDEAPPMLRVLVLAFLGGGQRTDAGWARSTAEARTPRSVTPVLLLPTQAPLAEAPTATPAPPPAPAPNRS